MGNGEWGMGKENVPFPIPYCPAPGAISRRGVDFAHFAASSFADRIVAGVNRG